MGSRIDRLENSTGTVTTELVARNANRQKAPCLTDAVMQHFATQFYQTAKDTGRADGSACEDYCVLGCDAVRSDTNLRTFRRKMLPIFSGQKNLP